MRQIDVPSELRDTTYSALEELAAECDRVRISALVELQRRDASNQRSTQNQRVQEFPALAQPAAQWLVRRSNRSLMVIAAVVALLLAVLRMAAGGLDSGTTSTLGKLQQQMDRARAAKSDGAATPPARHDPDLEHVFGTE